MRASLSAKDMQGFMRGRLKFNAIRKKQLYGSICDRLRRNEVALPLPIHAIPFVAAFRHRLPTLPVSFLILSSRRLQIEYRATAECRSWPLRAL